jgi:hypothetical protein
VICTILHELSHSLTLSIFGSQLTPAGCGVSAGNYGESGFVAENLLFGGQIQAVWRDGEVGEMTKIRGLVLDYQKPRTLGE